jgi:hypothetical protein
VRGHVWCDWCREWVAGTYARHVGECTIRIGLLDTLLRERFGDTSDATDEG